MERYFINGVQIGILKAVKNYPDSFKKIDEILKEIIDKQFIGNMLMPYEDYEIVIVKKKKLPDFIKDGVCVNKGKNICNLGYACDACPFIDIDEMNKKTGFIIDEIPTFACKEIPDLKDERIVSINIAVDEGNTHTTKLERHLIEEDITKVIELLGMKVKKFEMR
jgi:hypothetical protein